MVSRMRPALMGMFVLAAGWLVPSPVVAQTAPPARDPSVRVDGDYGYWLPPNIAKHEYAGQVDLLINVLHVFMVVLFVAWGAFFIYCLMKFRRRAGHSASPGDIKAKPSKYAEIGVAIFEAVLLLGISIPAWAEVKREFPGPDRNPLKIRVLGEQFQWNFHYAGADGVFGKTSAEKVDTTTNPVGLDRSDPHAADDFYTGEMHIPVDRPVIAEVTSKDVIHSFGVGVLRVKQDAIPGMRVPVWFEAGKTGKYEISCAQLCGNNHYAMRALMVVHPQAEYEAWAKERAKPPEEFEE